MSKYNDIVARHAPLLDHEENFHFVLEYLDGRLSNLHGLPVVEIGTNMAGSSLCFLEVMKAHKTGPLYTVDPYGSLSYNDGSGIHPISVYTNERYRKAMVDISTFCLAHSLDHCHFKTDSFTFAQYFLPHLYHQHDSISDKIEKIAFVYLDGSHDFAVMCKELDLFWPWIALSGTIFVDDTYNIRGQLSAYVKDHLSGSEGKDNGQRFIIDKIRTKADDPVATS